MSKLVDLNTLLAQYDTDSDSDTEVNDMGSKRQREDVDDRDAKRRLISVVDTDVESATVQLPSTRLDQPPSSTLSAIAGDSTNTLSSTKADGESDDLTASIIVADSATPSILTTADAPTTTASAHGDGNCSDSDSDSSSSSSDSDSDSDPCVLCRAQAKYTCPGCRRRTCSLPCVQKHKRKYDCTGIRPASSYVSLKEMNAQTLHRDVALLAKITGACGRANTVISARGGRVGRAGGAPGNAGASTHTHVPHGKPTAAYVAGSLTKETLPARLRGLLQAAMMRGVRLSFSPSGLSGYKRNLSYVARGLSAEKDSSGNVKGDEDSGKPENSESREDSEDGKGVVVEGVGMAGSGCVMWSIEVSFPSATPDNDTATATAAAAVSGASTGVARVQQLLKGWEEAVRARATASSASSDAVTATSSPVAVPVDVAGAAAEGSAANSSDSGKGDESASGSSSGSSAKGSIRAGTKAWLPSFPPPPTSHPLTITLPPFPECLPLSAAVHPLLGRRAHAVVGVARDVWGQRAAEEGQRRDGVKWSECVGDAILLATPTPHTAAESTTATAKPPHAAACGCGVPWDASLGICACARVVRVCPASNKSRGRGKRGKVTVDAVTNATPVTGEASASATSSISSLSSSSSPPSSSASSASLHPSATPSASLTVYTGPPARTVALLSAQPLPRTHRHALAAYAQIYGTATCNAGILSQAATCSSPTNTSSSPASSSSVPSTLTSTSTSVPAPAPAPSSTLPPPSHPAYWRAHTGLVAFLRVTSPANRPQFVLCPLDTPLSLALAHPLVSILDYPKFTVCLPAEAQLYLPFTVAVAGSTASVTHSAAQCQREADLWCDYWRVPRVRVSAVGAAVGLDEDVVQLIQDANDVRLQAPMNPMLAGLPMPDIVLEEDDEFDALDEYNELDALF